MKFTALEVLQKVGTTFKVGEAQFEAKDVFGKMRVRIGGIAGIVDADKLLNLQPGEIDIIVGSETYKVEIEAREEISEEVKAVQQARAIKIEEQNKKLAEFKATPKQPEPEEEEIF
jgi:hypothetical protein